MRDKPVVSFALLFLFVATLLSVGAAPVPAKPESVEQVQMFSVSLVVLNLGASDITAQASAMVQKDVNNWLKKQGTGCTIVDRKFSVSIAGGPAVSRDGYVQTEFHEYLVTVSVAIFYRE